MGKSLYCLDEAGLSITVALVASLPETPWKSKRAAGDNAIGDIAALRRRRLLVEEEEDRNLNMVDSSMLAWWQW